MAIPVQGCTISFGAVTLAEVSSIEIDETFSENVSRDGEWASTRGSISIAAYADISTAVTLGQREQLVLRLPQSTATSPPAQPVTLFGWDAIYRERKPSASANDVVRFDFTFIIADTQKAADLGGG